MSRLKSFLSVGAQRQQRHDDEEIVVSLFQVKALHSTAQPVWQSQLLSSTNISSISRRCVVHLSSAIRFRATDTCLAGQSELIIFYCFLSLFSIIIAACLAVDLAIGNRNMAS